MTAKLPPVVRRTCQLAQISISQMIGPIISALLDAESCWTKTAQRSQWLNYLKKTLNKCSWKGGVREKIENWTRKRQARRTIADEADFKPSSTARGCRRSQALERRNKYQQPFENSNGTCSYNNNKGRGEKDQHKRKSKSRLCLAVS